MSIVFNGSSQYAHRSAVPSTSAFLWCGWYLRDTDSGATEGLTALSDGSFFNATALQVNASDELRCYHFSGGNSGAVVSPFSTGTWRFVMVRYSGGTLVVRHLADGDTAWQSNDSSGGRSDLAPDRISIGSTYATASEMFGGKVAFVKVWSGTLPTDTEVLAERQYRSALVTTGLWANYKFQSGALDTDSSGNARTLTLVASPTYSASEPADVLGDAPASGPTFTAHPSNATAVVTPQETAQLTASSDGDTRQWQLETGVATDVYNNAADGNGLTFANPTGVTLGVTATTTAASGRRIRRADTNGSGTTYSNPATLTIRAGDTLVQPSGTTNASGVLASGTFATDHNGTGVRLVRHVATIDGVTLTEVHVTTVVAVP